MPASSSTIRRLQRIATRLYHSVDSAVYSDERQIHQRIVTVPL